MSEFAPNDLTVTEWMVSMVHRSCSGGEALDACEPCRALAVGAARIVRLEAELREQRDIFPPGSAEVIEKAYADFEVRIYELEEALSVMLQQRCKSKTCPHEKVLKELKS